MPLNTLTTFHVSPSAPWQHLNRDLIRGGATRSSDLACAELNDRKHNYKLVRRKGHWGDCEAEPLMFVGVKL